MSQKRYDAINGSQHRSQSKKETEPGSPGICFLEIVHVNPPAHRFNRKFVWSTAQSAMIAKTQAKKILILETRG